MRKHIRRCITCNNKTHRLYWKGNKCPICDSANFRLSSHGGMSGEELGEAKKRFRKLSQKHLIPSHGSR